MTIPQTNIIEVRPYSGGGGSIVLSLGVSAIGKGAACNQIGKQAEIDSEKAEVKSGALGDLPVFHRRPELSRFIDVTVHYTDLASFGSMAYQCLK